MRIICLFIFTLFSCTVKENENKELEYIPDNVGVIKEEINIICDTIDTYYLQTSTGDVHFMVEVECDTFITFR
jgi:hypothetical protein